MRQRRYLIGANKADLKKLAPQLAEARDWQQMRDSVEAKLCTGPDGEETFLLVRSADRQDKERAMHARFCERIEVALDRLKGGLGGLAIPTHATYPRSRRASPRHRSTSTS